MSICFNSRTPGGVRRFVRAFLLRLDEVSIHAPREGCDSSGGAPPNPQVAFQFTHPGRGATFSSASIRRRIVCFNSRTPGGVRRECAPHGAQVIWVSIHAPREGCDTSFSEMMMRASAFQFTHPGRGATRRRGSLPTSSTLFQFTHPGRGATKSGYSLCPSFGEFQFTHPGRGATSQRHIQRLVKPSFNSRTPGGVRQGKGLRSGVKREFQFTHPGRGATLTVSTIGLRLCSFNSRTPGGVRLST